MRRSRGDSSEPMPRLENIKIPGESNETPMQCKLCFREVILICAKKSKVADAQIRLAPQNFRTSNIQHQRCPESPVGAYDYSPRSRERRRTAADQLSSSPIPPGMKKRRIASSTLRRLRAKAMLFEIGHAPPSTDRAREPRNARALEETGGAPRGRGRSPRVVGDSLNVQGESEADLSRGTSPSGENGELEIEEDEQRGASNAPCPCRECGTKSRCKNRYDGLSTKCCTRCAKTHDPEWYGAYAKAHVCKYDQSSLCGTWGSLVNNGYCARCFAHLWPEDRRSRFVRSKEGAVTDFLASAFPELSWSLNKRIAGGCSRRRPDAFVHLGSHAMTIEVDEFEHVGGAYSCVCERKKMMEHFLDAGGVPHVFVRFNPDAYTDASAEKIPSCWGKTPKTGEPRVAPRQKRQWDERLEKLRLTVAHFLAYSPDREVELVQLFYSK